MRFPTPMVRTSGEATHVQAQARSFLSARLNCVGRRADLVAFPTGLDGESGDEARTRVAQFLNGVGIIESSDGIGPADDNTEEALS